MLLQELKALIQHEVSKSCNQKLLYIRTPSQRIIRKKQQDAKKQANLGQQQTISYRREMEQK